MNLVYGWCIERVEKRDEWDVMLNEPLPNQVVAKAEPTPFVAEQEGDDFMATLAMHQAQRR